MVVSRLKATSLSLPSLFLLAFHLSASQNVPEYSEAEHQQCVRKEHPTIAFEDLKPWVSNFTYPGVHDFSQLALDANRNQLIVGARYTDNNILINILFEKKKLKKTEEMKEDSQNRLSKISLECLNKFNSNNVLLLEKEKNCLNKVEGQKEENGKKEEASLNSSGRRDMDNLESLSDSLYDSFSSCTSQGSNDV